MPETFGSLTDTELRVRVDALRHALYLAWRRAQPGSTVAVYDLARATAEAQVRGISIAPLASRDQLRLF